MYRVSSFFQSAHLLASAVIFSSSGGQLTAQTIGYADGIELGQIKSAQLAELSGIAASRSNPGVLWVHNDRNRGDLTAVSTNGQILATWRLNEEVSDLEDIAIGPGPLPQLHYLYWGDVGDNAETRANVRLYRAGEPAAYSYQASEPASQRFPSVEKFTLMYPDGSHNAETLLVDPLTGDVLIATKERFRSRVYRAASAQLQPGATVTLTLVADVQFDNASSGDISPDGQAIILRQEDFARVWRRAPGQSVADAFASLPTDVPVIGTPKEPNGEGIAFAADGRGYYTVSEGANPVLYFFAPLTAPPTTALRELLPPASVWRFKDDGSNQGTAWCEPEFNDNAWPRGPGQFGYGEDDEQTVLAYGGDKDRKTVTTYFRAQFQTPDPSLFGALIMKLLFDDGVAVYINGLEVLRRNLADGAAFSDPSLAAGSDYENLWQTFTLENLLRAGTNTIAVELHRYSRTEADLSFDLQLLATPHSGGPQFIGPPRRGTADNWVLDIQAPGLAAVALESSSDLIHWRKLADVALTDGLGAATLSAQPLPYSFYRLR